MWSLWLIIAICGAQAIAKHISAANLIHQYRPVTWVENIGVRPNGLLLPITTTSPILNQLNPATGQLQQVYNFSAAGNAIQGITAVQPDLFVVDVLTCNISSLSCTPKSVSTWRVDFRNSARQQRNEKNVACVDKVAKLPRAGFLNGMAALNARTALMADSFRGGIWSLDIWSGEKQLVFTDKTMMPTPNIGTGINGIRVRPGMLYFTNSARGTFNSIPIDMKTGNKIGSATVITTGLSGPDDFEVDLLNGVAYVANGAVDELLKISLESGKYEVVTKAPGPTSARWSNQKHSGGSKLYLSTIGGLAQYVTGNVTRGGAIYEIKV